MRFMFYVLDETAKLIVFIYLCKYFLKIRLVLVFGHCAGTGGVLQAKGEEGRGERQWAMGDSQKNLNFYLHRGYKLFDERVFDYHDRQMGSWTLKKNL